MYYQYLPKILTRQNLPMKAFLHLMRKEDPYLLEVCLQEDHLNGGKGLIADRRLGYLIFFPEGALKPIILVKQK